MISYIDCEGMCGLTDKEVEAIANGAHISPIEACALAEHEADTPKGCRHLLSCMQTYLEYVEAHDDARRSHEVHDAMNHFVASHHFV